MFEKILLDFDDVLSGEESVCAVVGLLHFDIQIVSVTLKFTKSN